MPASGLAVSAAKRPVVRYLSCLRHQEILTLQGAPLLGAAFALRHPTADHAALLAIFAAASIGLVAYVFALNDWSDRPTDLTDPNKAAGVFTARAVEDRTILGLALGALALSLLLFALLGPATLYLSIGVATLGALYSLPPFRWKGRPLFSSVAHLAGGALHFLLGYSLGNAIDGHGLALATFFGLTFAAGHLTQEVRDYQGDVGNGTRTNAVIFGQRRVFLASLVLFTMVHGLLLLFALQGLLPRPLAALVVFYPVHFGWSLETLHEGLSYKTISRLQVRYRLLFAAIGLTIAASLWLA